MQLSINSLDSYAELLRQIGVPVALRPGLTDPEIDALTGPLGLRLPPEARTWWRWRNGRPENAITYTKEREIAPYREFFPLEEAVQHYTEGREEAVRLAASARPNSRHPEVEEVDYWWPRTWFPLTRRNSEWIVFDCAQQGDQSPLMLRDYGWLGDTMFQPRAESIGQLVAWWADAMAQGVYDWNREEGTWLVTQGAPPVAVELAGL